MTRLRSVASIKSKLAIVAMLLVFIALLFTLIAGSGFWGGISLMTRGFGGGDGTPEHPYIVVSRAGFAYMAREAEAGNSFSGKHFKLADDVDMGGETVPIGRLGKPFNGLFDGNGKTVSNIAINLPNNGGVGLFGSIGREGRVADLNIREADISGGWNVGGVAGYNGGSLVNVSIVGKVSGVLDNTGGLAGLNGGVIRDCRANVAVEGESAVGGLAGSNNGEIAACVATAAACLGEDNAGGIAGMNAGTISDSLASGYVEGVIRAGGIAGLNRGTVGNSAASGAVSGI
ncbi:MAG: hypothetical protein LBQ19_04335, partial [Synergistaceae bacterium]|nr:hypothetical protein [Synergistaceae bacterium]